MNLIKTYMFQIVSSIIFVLIILFFLNGDSPPTVEEYVCDYNSHWNISIDGSVVLYNKIPSKIENESMLEVTYEKMLPSYIKSGESILFYTSHQSVRVYIGHRLVYEFKVEKSANSKTSGNGWHIIRLENGYAEEKIRIVITPDYKSVAGTTPDFHYGQSAGLIGYVIKSNFTSILLCIVLFVVGVFVLIGAIIFRKYLEMPRYLIWLGLFSVMISIWSISDLDILPLFLGYHLLNSQITYISLKLAYFPVVTYIQKIYDGKENKILRLLGIFSIADFLITLFMQLFGVVDFKESIFVFHALFLCSVIIIIYTNVKELIIGKDKLMKTVKIHLLSIVLLAICGLVDLITYYVFHATDSGIFIKVGILGYIIVLLYLAVNRSIKLIRSNEQLDRINQIASFDAITQLSNRAVFQEDINAILEKDYPDYGIAVFDLNDLKEFNDQYGHSVGDYYIIISSEILQDVFGKYGTVYRIGGDEFCSIIKGVSEDGFRALEDKMNKRIEGLNGMYFSRNMSIAAGYATYDSDHDLSLNDTFQRADKDMYRDKRRKKGVVR